MTECTLFLLFIGILRAIRSKGPTKLFPVIGTLMVLLTAPCHVLYLSVGFIVVVPSTQQRRVYYCECTSMISTRKRVRSTLKISKMSLFALSLATGGPARYAQPPASPPIFGVEHP